MSLCFMHRFRIISHSINCHSHLESQLTFPLYILYQKINEKKSQRLINQWSDNDDILSLFFIFVHLSIQVCDLHRNGEKNIFREIPNQVSHTYILTHKSSSFSVKLYRQSESLIKCICQIRLTNKWFITICDAKHKMKPKIDQRLSFCKTVYFFFFSFEMRIIWLLVVNNHFISNWLSLFDWFASKNR